MRRLVKLLDHKDSQLVSQALTALQQLTNDKEAENHRIKYWELYEYAGVIKNIKKLDQDKQKAILLLTEKLKEEKADAVKKR
ncbi:MAG: hypothetical protein JXC36_05850 [Candidatus Atribacteria bacterium]|nr:hypothetical protein [Candidatus Atribacteria bacterium]